MLGIAIDVWRGIYGGSGGGIPANAIYDTSASVITDSSGSIITTA